MEIPQLTRNASVAELVEAMNHAGCAIVRELVDPQTMDRIDAELGPYLGRVPMSLGSFMGLKTQRTSRLIVKSPTTRELVMNPLMLGALDELFRNECYFFQLHGTQAIRIWPGEKMQSLHRDDAVFPFKHPAPPCLLNTMWALTDFTAENGATRVIPGSHLWDDERKPTEDEVVRAEMPRGSVMMLAGGTYHGGSSNRSESPRTGISLLYSLGWLRQEENHYLAVPPEIAKTLPEELQRLIGYRAHGYLGQFEGQDVRVLLQDEPLPDVLPATDLYDGEVESIEVRRR